MCGLVGGCGGIFGVFLVIMYMGFFNPLIRRFKIADEEAPTLACGPLTPFRQVINPLIIFNPLIGGFEITGWVGR